MENLPQLMAIQDPVSSICLWSKRTPQADAVISGEEKVSYEALATYIGKFIKTFKAAGVKKGMFIGLQMDKQSKVLELVLAYSLEAIGAIRVTQITEGDIVRRCDFIFTFTPHSFRKDSPTLINLTQEWVSTAIKQPLFEGELEKLKYQPESTDAVFFGSTSGTTGKRKYFSDTYASMQTQFELMKSIYFSGETRNFLSVYGIGLGAAYVGCSLALMQGGVIIFTSLEQFAGDINTYPHSHSALLLRDASYLSRSISSAPSDRKLDTLRVLGAHLPEHLRSWLKGNIANQVFNSYSSNESGQIANVKVNGEGDIYPGVSVKIVDKNRETLPFGEIGQIAVKSPLQITNYLWDAPLNMAYFQGEWFYSNDLGYMPQAGRLVVIDRMDNMLNMGGIKVPPKPIEDVLNLIKNVNDCALLSENSFFDSETLIVCIEVAKDIDKKMLDQNISRALEGRFSSMRICYFEAFPRTETGKIQRKLLQALVLERLTLNTI